MFEQNSERPDVRRMERRSRVHRILYRWERAVRLCVLVFVPVSAGAKSGRHADFIFMKLATPPSCVADYRTRPMSDCTHTPANLTPTSALGHFTDAKNCGTAHSRGMNQFRLAYPDACFEFFPRTSSVDGRSFQGLMVNTVCHATNGRALERSEIRFPIDC